MFRHQLIPLIALLLVACSSPSNRLPDLTFKHLPPIQLRVAEIQIVSAASIPTEQQNVGHRFPVSPEQALMRWVKDRFRLSGKRGMARFTILRADATETKLKKDEKLTGLFKQQASEQYNTTVKARLEIIDTKGIQRARFTASANWRQNIREDTSLIDRRRIWLELTEKLMNQFNREMDQGIQRFMAEYVF